MSKFISPFTPTSYPVMPAIKGARFAVTECGIKYNGVKKNVKADVMLAEFAKGTTVAGMFTKSKTASANIIDGQQKIKSGKTARVLVVNSGNANAFNGIKGEESVERIVKACSVKFACDPDEIYTSATGVIGQPLPDHLITESIDTLVANLKESSWHEAATAIMTTDTFRKVATTRLQIDDKTITINGMAKGSGMICPDMATMLSYIVTDANVSKAALQEMLEIAVNDSFNAITVDSDTSTSDTVLLFATNQAGNQIIDKPSKDFQQALSKICLELAHLIVKDGEGATKFVTINVSGAEDDRAAKVIAYAIANSPLVKTAIAGSDANWGRIVMAVGKSGEAASRDKMAISIGGVNIVKDGQLNPSYKEDMVASHMKGTDIEIDVAVGIANGKATVWTCDLTHEYISINADYRS